VELYQVGEIRDEAEKSVSWEPVATIKVARADESGVEVLLNESGQLRDRYAQR